MNPETKQKINAKYERELQRGEFFWPDSIFKDVIVSLGIFLVLLLLATFVGVHDAPKADPSDTSYIPRPEWYFLFLFKFLALYGQIPVLGKIEWVATVVIPGLAIALLTLLPFIDKTPHRYYARRALPLAIMAILVLGIVLLTFLADVPTVAADGSSLLGTLQTLAGLVIPSLAYLAFIMFAYRARENAVRLISWTSLLAGVLMIGCTVATLALHQPAAAEAAEVPASLVDRIVAGQDLYSIHCVECHGEDGAVTTIEGVKGLEGKEIPPINGKDILYTLNDASLSEVIAYGRPDAGMNPFGKAYNPEGLTRSEIDYIVTFMRYSWDDRFEKPQIKPLFPPLAEGEVPSYAVHIQPIVKRYCISCHRPGKDSYNYFMDTYENILKSGDDSDSNVIAGDENSFLLQVIQGTPIPDTVNPGKDLIGVMPPKGHLKPDAIEAFRRWILMGMPETAEDAAGLTWPTPAATPKP
jgi:mono/diheme cytochrome c family protein